MTWPSIIREIHETCFKTAAGVPEQRQNPPCPTAAEDECWQALDDLESRKYWFEVAVDELAELTDALRKLPEMALWLWPLKAMLRELERGLTKVNGKIYELSDD